MRRAPAKPEAAQRILRPMWWNAHAQRGRRRAWNDRRASSSCASLLGWARSAAPLRRWCWTPARRSSRSWEAGAMPAASRRSRRTGSPSRGRSRRRWFGRPGAADVRRRGAMVDRRRPGPLDRLTHRGPIEQIRRLPAPDASRRGRRRAAGPVPRDDRGRPSPASRIEEVAAGKAGGGAGDENRVWHRSRLSRHAAERAVERARVAEVVKNRWSFGTLLRNPKFTVWVSNARPQHCAL